MQQVVSIHAARVGRDVLQIRRLDLLSVSIHAARVGRDVPRQGCPCSIIVSIHAARVGRDLHAQRGDARLAVSIHAARVGRDLAKCTSARCSQGFNPRGPCGPRPVIRTDEPERVAFQSTRPVWAATSTSLLRTMA